MWFLALELWPYLIGALVMGLATGWLSGCAPKRRRREVKTVQETTR